MSGRGTTTGWLDRNITWVKQHINILIVVIRDCKVPIEILEKRICSVGSDRVSGSEGVQVGERERESKKKKEKRRETYTIIITEGESVNRMSDVINYTLTRINGDSVVLRKAARAGVFVNVERVNTPIGEIVVTITVVGEKRERESEGSEDDME